MAQHPRLVAVSFFLAILAAEASLAQENAAPPAAPPAAAPAIQRRILAAPARPAGAPAPAPIEIQIDAQGRVINRVIKWPDAAAQPGAITNRFRQFDRALDIMGEHLHNLERDVQNGVVAEAGKAHFRQFDRALDIMRDHLQKLELELQGGVGVTGGAIRRDEEGFRAIYTAKRDGTDVEFAAAAPGAIASVDPQMSPDGSMVVFCANPTIDAVTEAKVYVAALSGPFKGTVRDFGYGNAPDFSPDGRHIAYMINVTNPIGAQGGTWIMDADGKNRRWLAMAFHPRWSPDGKQLLCHTFGGPVRSLALIDVATGAMRELLPDTWRLQMYGGDWSPDGKKVAFIGAFDGKHRLAMIDVTGDPASIQILYTIDAANQSLAGPPTWSPDGKQIIFSAQEPGGGPRNWWKSYLYSYSFDTPDTAVLLEKERVGNINRNPSFFGDGSRLVFSSER